MSNKPYFLSMVQGALSDYYDWVQSAKHGDVMIYWIGDLQFDRSIDIPATDVLRAERRMEIRCLNDVADRVMADSKSGIISLTQKKIEESVYEYRATRIRRQLIGNKTETTPNDDLVPA